MIDQILKQELEENDCLLAAGYNRALIGITEGPKPVAVYDVDLCIQCLMEEDNMSKEDAVDFFYYNTVGSYVGDKTPIYIRRYE
tara:strand:+ start:254 stop:505 length:252 start_codon:yes stop_codon:yes gene_type:complete